MDILVPSIIAIGAGIATAYFSSRFYVLRARADLEKEFESRFNERKWKIYTDFSDTIREVLESQREKTLQSQLPKFVRKITAFTSNLWLTGSDEVVRAYIEWQRCSRAHESAAEAGKNPREILTKLMAIITAMRRDLGYKTTDIAPEELLATFVHDIDQYLVDS